MTDICQPTVWSYFGGYCYFTSGRCASWLNADLNCTAMSSDLVTVHNQEENVYIQHRHNGERSWIGLNDRSVEGRFAWANTEISNFEHWAPQQPNDWKNEDCVHTLGVRHDYTWNDVPCDNCYNYTCFKDLDECATNAYTCGVNAECRNTVGSYRCVCKVGFHGDGHTCNDTDECARGTDDCHRTLASCTNTIGSFICRCDYQYTGDGRICSILVTECQPETNVRPDGYVSLSSSDRALNYTTRHEDCDSKIGTTRKTHGYTGSRWFRFEGAAGDNMATTCPYRTGRCNTYATGWLNGGLPNIAEKQVTRQVCFYGSRGRKPRENNCCEWAINVQVRNCGSYYVYNLTTTPGGECNLRYCGNNDYNAYG